MSYISSISVVPNETLITDGYGNLTSFAYATTATANTFVKRDGYGSINIGGAQITSPFTEFSSLVTPPTTALFVNPSSGGNAAGIYGTAALFISPSGIIQIQPQTVSGPGNGVSMVAGTSTVSTGGNILLQSGQAGSTVASGNITLNATNGNIFLDGYTTVTGNEALLGNLTVSGSVTAGTITYSSASFSTASVSTSLSSTGTTTITSQFSAFGSLVSPPSTAFYINPVSGNYAGLYSTGELFISPTLGFQLQPITATNNNNGVSCNILAGTAGGTGTGGTLQLIGGNAGSGGGYSGSINIETYASSSTSGSISLSTGNGSTAGSINMTIGTGSTGAINMLGNTNITGTTYITGVTDIQGTTYINTTSNANTSIGTLGGTGATSLSDAYIYMVASSLSIGNGSTPNTNSIICRGALLLVSITSGIPSGSAGIYQNASGNIVAVNSSGASTTII